MTPGPCEILRGKEQYDEAPWFMECRKSVSLQMADSSGKQTCRWLTSPFTVVEVDEIDPSSEEVAGEDGDLAAGAITSFPLGV